MGCYERRTLLNIGYCNEYINLGIEQEIIKKNEERGVKMKQIYKIEYKLGDWVVFREEKYAFDEMECPQGLESIVQDIASFLRDSNEEMPIDYLKVRVNGEQEYRFRIAEEKISIFSVFAL